MEGCVDIPVKEGRLTDLAVAATDCVYSQGVLLRKSTQDKPNLTGNVHAPVVLFPSPWPRVCYKHAIMIQEDLNLLMHRVAHDHDFLKECLHGAIEVDDFTRHLWNIYETVRKEPNVKPAELAIFRSDYMLQTSIPTEQIVKEQKSLCTQDIELKQVEFNTIACGMGAMAPRLYTFHKYMLEEMGMHDKVKQLVDTPTGDQMGEAVVSAWNLYNNPQAVVLFLVYKLEQNAYDQRWVEYAIKKCNSKVKVIRRSLQDIQERGTLTDDKRLIIDGDEVAVIYLRSCYKPDDFKTDKDWETRLMMEQSRAVLCSSVAHQLASAKKVQQVLARPGVLERFLEDPEAIQRIRSTFVGLYSIDRSPEGDAAVEMALENPDRYILKPQRDGGGNNKYGDDLRDTLLEIRDSDDRSGYILMEKINAAPSLNYPLVDGAVRPHIHMVGELGIFGAIVSTGDNHRVVLNTMCGPMLRSKPWYKDEGSTMSGDAVLDTPLLI